MKLEAPIVRVFRGETWLAVYRSVAVRNRLGTPMGGGDPPATFRRKMQQKSKVICQKSTLGGVSTQKV